MSNDRDDRRDEQQQRLREHHLRDHERVLQTRASCRTRRRILERRGDSAARGVQRWREPAQNSRAERDEHREGDGSEIGSEKRRPWDSRERDDHSPKDDEAERSAEHREHYAFRQQLADHTRARCAE
jgi:hypothetical protein